MAHPTAAKLAARGQTNFLRMLWKFNSVYNAERQVADHSRPVQYEMKLPEHTPETRVKPSSWYIHPLQLLKPLRASAGAGRD